MKIRGHIFACISLKIKGFSFTTEALREMEVPPPNPLVTGKKLSKDQGYTKVLLLATKFTMEDGFFAKKLENAGIEVVNQKEAVREVIWGDSQLAPTFSEGITDIQKNNRLYCLIAAERAGLTNYVYEWWHFSVGDRYDMYWKDQNGQEKVALYGSVE